MPTNDSRALLVQLYAPDNRWHDVGELVHQNEQSLFTTLERYWQEPNRPVLGQQFEENGPDWTPHSSIKLPTWFSHLLPEGYMRAIVSQSVGVHPDREFFLLERLGKSDLPGATRVVPQDSSSDVAISSSEADDANGSDDNDPLLKFSLAGVQLKFSVYGDRQRGLTVPVSSQAGNWIAKLPDGRANFKNVPEAEYAAMELARGAGIETPELMLVDVENIANIPEWAHEVGGRALAVSRYDRTSEGGRVHSEELAQILNVRTNDQRGKYGRANFERVAEILDIVAGSEVVGEVIDRIVLNVLVGNGDAHIKNWSIIYPDGRTPSLSPVYDVVPTVLYMPNDNLGLNLDRSKSFVDVTPASFDRMAARVGWQSDRARTRASTMVEKVVDSWPVLRELLSDGAYKRITQHRDSLKILS